MWDTAEKIGFIVIVGVLMLLILRSSGEFGSRSLTVSRPAHFEGEPPTPHGGPAEAARAGEHGGPSGDPGQEHGYRAYDRAQNVGRQAVILVALLVVMLALVWIGKGSLGIFWY